MQTPKQPNNRGFHDFFNEKTMKTYKCHWLLDSSVPETVCVFLTKPEK
jgi:hypothetical protein